MVYTLNLSRNFAQSFKKLKDNEKKSYSVVDLLKCCNIIHSIKRRCMLKLSAHCLRIFSLSALIEKLISCFYSRSSRRRSPGNSNMLLSYTCPSRKGDTKHATTTGVYPCSTPSQARYLQGCALYGVREQHKDKYNAFTNALCITSLFSFVK